MLHTILYVLLGMFAYMVMQFRTANATFTDVATWFKFNIWNILATTVAAVIYIINIDHPIGTMEAILLGFLPQKPLDWLQSFVIKKGENGI